MHSPRPAAVTRTLIAALFALGLSAMLSASPRGEIEFSGCYAKWDENTLVVGNLQFERSWFIAPGGLTPKTFRTKAPDKLWMEIPASTPGPDAPPAAVLDVQAESGQFSVVEAASLRLRVSARGSQPQQLTLQVFPGTPGVLITEQDPTGTATGWSQAAPAAVSGIEIPAVRATDSLSPLDWASVLLVPEHVRVLQVELVDQTDVHDELVFEREWLLTRKESPFTTAGNLLITEDSLTGDGLVYVSFAPLPHARPVKRAHDFELNPRRGLVQPVRDHYPAAVIAYAGGPSGRVAALQQLQRQLRVYQPDRDGRFLSNTWGDRSRDARINAEFIAQEIAAGARLGVEVIQIDDGWQKGVTLNSAKGGGVWNGYWAADPEFWRPHPTRFPHGLAPVVAAAHARGLRFGLWFAPDSSNDAANWSRDADQIIALHRELKIDYVKVDSIKAPTLAAARNQRSLFDRVLEATQGAVVFDLDVTAEIRPGYFGLPHIGPLFVENRYTDFRSYWPHRTLRNLWRLAHYIDPVRLRMEFLNPERNTGNYGEDPLAPCRYRPDTLFAITMMANPLGWFENSNLSAAFVEQVAPLVSKWKDERTPMQRGTILPVGATPDGIAWTGFISRAPTGDSGYALLFRELNRNDTFQLSLDGFTGEKHVTVLAGRGTAAMVDGQLRVRVPELRDYIWVKIESTVRGPR